jgi:hypothetical protein
MLDDMEWATADLEHAKTLYEQCQASGVPVSETWESNGFVWRMRTWQEEISTRAMGGGEGSVKGLMERVAGRERSGRPPYVFLDRRRLVRDVERPDPGPLVRFLGPLCVAGAQAATA